MSVYLPPCEFNSTGHLRVFPQSTPEIQPPVRSSAPKSFEPFNKAFQLATGWKLSWQAPPHLRSPLAAETILDSDITLSGNNRMAPEWLAIEDLSRLLPPGIAATSRIYCENMVLRLNRVLDELTGQNIPDDKNVNLTAPAVPNYGIPDRLQPCFLDQFSVVPLVLPEIQPDDKPTEMDGCQWLIHPSGSVSAVAISISGSSGLLAAGLMAAHSCFLTAARLDSECQVIHEQISQGIAQMFCGDVQVHSVVWTLDPLMGRASVCGDDSFDLNLDQQLIPFEPGRSHTFSWFRKQVLLATRWPRRSTGPSDDFGDWTRTTFSHLSENEPGTWQTTLPGRLDSVIPSVTDSPELALAMIRF